MVVIASPNRRYRPEPDALALAALVVEYLDELTPDAIESAARRATTRTSTHDALHQKARMNLDKLNESGHRIR